MNELIEFRHGNFRGVVVLVLFTAIAIEVLVSWRKDLKNYDLKETGSNIVIFVGLQLSKFVFAAYQIWLLQFFSTLALFHLSTSVLVFIAGFLFTDFLYYVYHYLSHKLKLLWAFHIVHHSSPWMNLTTAYRLNWLGGLITPIFFFPAILLGFSPSLVVICISINLLYQFFLHTELVARLGWIEKVINTPSSHRVHHGSNPNYLDKNFGGVFILWDRLFGTYQPETEKVVYGITEGFVSHNPVVLVFHGFIELFQRKSIPRIK